MGAIRDFVKQATDLVVAAIEHHHDFLEDVFHADEVDQDALTVIHERAKRLGAVPIHLPPGTKEKMYLSAGDLERYVRLHELDAGDYLMENSILYHAPWAYMGPKHRPVVDFLTSANDGLCTHDRIRFRVHVSDEDVEGIPCASMLKDIMRQLRATVHQNPGSLEVELVVVVTTAGDNLLALFESVITDMWDRVSRAKRLAAAAAVTRPIRHLYTRILLNGESATDDDDMEGWI